MSKNKESAKVAKLLKILTGESKNSPIANVINSVQIKEFEQLRPIVPIEKWINDPYYCGKDCVDKLYPFWKDLICEIFRDGKQNYNQIVLTGGIGCRPIDSTYYETSSGLLNLSEIKNKLDNGEDLYINTEVGIEKIINVHYIGLKECIKVTLDNKTEFIGTVDHLLKDNYGEKNGQVIVPVIFLSFSLCKISKENA